MFVVQLCRNRTPVYPLLTSHTCSQYIFEPSLPPVVQLYHRRLNSDRQHVVFAICSVYLNLWLDTTTCSAHRAKTNLLRWNLQPLVHFCVFFVGRASVLVHVVRSMENIILYNLPLPLLFQSSRWRFVTIGIFPVILNESYKYVVLKFHISGVPSVNAAAGTAYINILRA